jgi:hypothetical protein
MGSRLVHTGTIELSYSVWEYDVDGEPTYGWMLDSGETSDSTFPTVRDTEFDLKSRYQ